MNSFPPLGAGLDHLEGNLRASCIFLVSRMAKEVSELGPCFLSLCPSSRPRSTPALGNGVPPSMCGHAYMHAHTHTHIHALCLWLHHFLVMAVPEMSMKRAPCSNMKSVLFFPHLLFPVVLILLHFIWVLLTPVHRYLRCFGGLFPEHTGERVKTYLLKYLDTGHLLSLTTG